METADDFSALSEPFDDTKLEGAEVGMRLIAAPAPRAMMFEISEAIGSVLVKKHAEHAETPVFCLKKCKEKFSEWGIDTPIKNLRCYFFGQTASAN
jgi:hypothetical protein